MLSYNQLFKLNKMFIDGDDFCCEKTLYDYIELDEMKWNYTLLNCPPSEFIMSGPPEFEYYEKPPTSKIRLRSHDCMWSGRCTTHPDRLNCYNSSKENHDNSKKGTGHSNDTHQTQIHAIHPRKMHQETIPAGQSLLINSRLNQTKHSVIKVPSVSTNDFLKDREYIARPDTPLSLDDEPEFKHTVDVSACLMGSNKQPFVSDNETPTEIINLLKEHLQNEDLHVKNSKLHSFLPGSKSGSLSDFLKDIKSLSDYEDIEGEDSDENESDSDSNGVQASVSSSSHSSYDYSQTTHSDHSYTRSKNRVDVNALGVQTPSDSEEEIDVVSVGEKALPTNPTAKDRRALQTTVAHKISNRIVKTQSGVRTIPPRRRYSIESENSINSPPAKPFTSLSHSFVKYNGNNDNGTVSRKRPHRDDRSTNTSNKRFRGNKKIQQQQQQMQLQQQQQQQQLQQQQHRSPMKRPASDTDETETIEKRNLHNNMERQRRIGLKNLFEELKRQIPNLKDKDRAPKVSILREAANLCRRFNKEEDEKVALRKIQAKLYNRVSVLRTCLAAQRSRLME